MLTFRIMIRNIQKVLMPFIFSALLSGCKSLSVEKTETFDFDREENSYEINFPAESSTSLYLFRLEFSGNTNKPNFEAISVKMDNQLESKINIKAQLESEELEIISESGIYTVGQKEEKLLTIDLEHIPEESNAASITFFIEGNLSGGTIFFEDLKLVGN